MGSRIGKIRWNAERFGLTPSKLRARLFDDKAPSVVSNSLPKAGTHLLERALCLHPRLYRSLRRTLHDRRVPAMGDLVDVVPSLRAGELLVTHLSHNAEREQVLSQCGAGSLFLVRDPRDIVISQAHYVVRREKHPHYDTLSRIDDFQDRLRRVITGDPDRGMPSLRSRLESYSGWLDSDALLVRYEDLVGESGGGDQAAQWNALRAVFDHIGLHLSEQDLKSLSSATFSTTSPTFRRGKIHQWTEQFDDLTMKTFTEEVGELADLYGYGSHVPPSGGSAQRGE